MKESGVSSVQCGGWVRAFVEELFSSETDMEFVKISSELISVWLAWHGAEIQPLR